MHMRSLADVIRDQTTLTITAGATVQEACTAMHRHRYGAVLIVEGEKLRGIFTGRDAMHALAVGLDPVRTLVGQVMTADPCCLTPAHRAIDALRLMNDGGFRHVPIVEDGRVRGIVSRYDFRSIENNRIDEEKGLFEVIR